MSFICVADYDPALANDVAAKLEEAAWSMREALNTGGMKIEAALERTRQATRGRSRSSMSATMSAAAVRRTPR